MATMATDFTHYTEPQVSEIRHGGYMRSSLGNLGSDELVYLGVITDDGAHAHVLLTKQEVAELAHELIATVAVMSDDEPPSNSSTS